jgi:hypothetical protein
MTGVSLAISPQHYKPVMISKLLVSTYKIYFYP